MLFVPRLAEQFDAKVDRISLSILTTAVFTRKTTVICAVELYDPLLTTLSETEMNSMKIMTDNAAFILWIHGGGNINATCPDLAMITDFSRSLVLEQPSLSFSTYDIENPELDTVAFVTNILASIDDRHDNDCKDLQVVEKNSIPHTQRFVLEEGLNSTFRQKLGNKVATKVFGEAKPARLTI